jgi:hypothetical protein
MLSICLPIAPLPLASGFLQPTSCSAQTMNYFHGLHEHSSFAVIPWRQQYVVAAHFISGDEAWSL